MKAILLTISATLAAVGLLAALFFQSILGVFGLAAISIDALQSLRTSQHVVERMKERHSQKKLKSSSKFVTRPVKRIAATTLAAASLGAVAVAVTMASLEVADYCEEQQELQKDADILKGTETNFDVAQCIEEGKKDSIRILREVKSSSVKVVRDAFENTSQYSAKKWGAVKEAGLQALDWMREEAAELWDAAKPAIVK